MGQGHLLVRVTGEVLLRSNVGVVRPNQAGREEEGFVVLLQVLQQLDRLGGGLPVRLVGTISNVIDGNEHAIRHFGRLPALQFGGELIEVQAGIVSRRVGFFARHVVLGRPACGHIRPIGTCDDVSGNAHVKDLTYPRAGKTILEEMLAPSNPLVPLTATSHKACPRRSAHGALAIGVAEERPLLRQLVEVRCLG